MARVSKNPRGKDAKMEVNLNLEGNKPPTGSIPRRHAVKRLETGAEGHVFDCSLSDMDSRK